jgi:hypothetical protein
MCKITICYIIRTFLHFSSEELFFKKIYLHIPILYVIKSILTNFHCKWSLIKEVMIFRFGQTDGRSLNKVSLPPVESISRSSLKPERFHLWKPSSTFWVYILNVFSSIFNMYITIYEENVDKPSTTLHNLYLPLAICHICILCVPHIYERTRVRFYLFALQQ